MASWLVLGAFLALGGCGMFGQSSEQARQQAVTNARKLCVDFGYKAGTTEFAQCVQAEYDRGSHPAEARAAQPSSTPPATAQAQPAQSKADATDDWLERWIHKPPCSSCAGFAH